MPETTLTEGEFARVKEIMAYKLRDDLWQRYLEYEPLNAEETKMVEIAGF